MSMLFRHALGSVLRGIRVEQKRSLREVAASAGMSVGYLSEIERGHKESSSELLAAAASALGVPVATAIAQAAAQMMEADAAVSVLSIPAQAGNDASAQLQLQRPSSAA
jgi:transcriptional regulator with XRE-family HTH domain